MVKDVSRHYRDGLCLNCSKPAVTAFYCEAHLRDFDSRMNQLLEEQHQAREAAGINQRVRDRIKKVIIFQAVQKAKRMAAKMLRKTRPKTPAEAERLVRHTVDRAVEEFEKDLAVRLIANGSSTFSDFTNLIHRAAEKNDGLFLRRISAAGKKQKNNKRIFDEIDTWIVRLWDGAECLYGYPYPNLPGLKSWTGPAASKCIAHLIGEPGFSYEAYKKRCLRSLGLHPPTEKKKVVIRSATYVRKTVGRSLAGREVFDHILEAVPPLESFLSTRKSEGHTGVLNMSRDKVTPALFNAASENGKNGLKRSSRKKHRVNRRAAV